MTFERSPQRCLPHMPIRPTSTRTPSCTSGRVYALVVFTREGPGAGGTALLDSWRTANSKGRNADDSRTARAGADRLSDLARLARRRGPRESAVDRHRGRSHHLGCTDAASGSRLGGGNARPFNCRRVQTGVPLGYPVDATEVPQGCCVLLDPLSLEVMVLQHRYSSCDCSIQIVLVEHVQPTECVQPSQLRRLPK